MRVRVATYNLYLGADLSGLLREWPGAEPGRLHHEVARQLRATAFPRRASAIAALLAREAPDLVGLQEVCLWCVDGTPRWDFRELLLTALAEQGTPYEPVASVATFGGGGELPVGEDATGDTLRLGLSVSNVLLRRVDSPLHVTGRRRGTFRAALAAAVPGVPGRAVRRGWCEVTVTTAPDVGCRPLRVVCTHTEAYDPVTRDHQRDELLAVLPPGPLVVLGDLNAPPDQVGITAGLSDAWLDAGRPDTGPEAATSGQDPDLANPVSALSERIDYVWVRGPRVLAASRFGAADADRVGGLWPSDHAGVCVELDLGEE